MQKKNMKFDAETKIKCDPEKYEILCREKYEILCRKNIIRI